MPITNDTDGKNDTATDDEDDCNGNEDSYNAANKCMSSFLLPNTTRPSSPVNVLGVAFHSEYQYPLALNISNPNNSAHSNGLVNPTIHIVEH